MKTKLKVSDLIKNSCCSTTLDVPKNKLCELAKGVEDHNEKLLKEIKELRIKNKRLFSGFIAMFFILLLSIALS